MLLMYAVITCILSFLPDVMDEFLNIFIINFIHVQPLKVIYADLD